MAKTNNIGGFYRFLEWLMWVFYINILWLAFTFIGFIAFGIFPATAAMYAVYQDWFRKDVQEVQITKVFIKTYKQEFFKANGIGYITLLIGYILYLDFQLLANIQGFMLYIMQAGLVILGTIYFIMILYIFPVYVYFDLKFFRYFKNALLIGFFSPLPTILMVVALVLFAFLFNYIPGLLPSIGISLSAASIMGCALFAFKSIERKQRKFTEK